MLRKKVKLRRRPLNVDGYLQFKIECVAEQLTVYQRYDGIEDRSQAGRYLERPFIS